MAHCFRGLSEVRSNAGSTSFRVRALTDLLGKHPSAVWRTADGSNAKSKQVLKLSACYYDQGPAAYEVAHIPNTLVLSVFRLLAQCRRNVVLQQVGSYLGWTGRGANAFRKAAHGPGADNRRDLPCHGLQDLRLSQFLQLNQHQIRPH